MCGRYSLVASIAELEGRFGFDGTDAAYSPSYNIAPTQGVLTVVTENEEKRAARMRWGLIPSWAREASIGSRMINARAETVAEKPSFRTALRRRRCLVLADGFYEWRRTGADKRPMRVTMASGEPFAFAGLWDTWRDPQDGTVTSCTIITTGANDLLRSIHDRMPVILQREQEDLWLAQDVREPDVLREVLTPYDPGAMMAYEVSTLVNSPANDGPELSVPVNPQF